MSAISAVIFFISLQAAAADERDALSSELGSLHQIEMNALHELRRDNYTYTSMCRAHDPDFEGETPNPLLPKYILSEVKEVKEFARLSKDAVGRGDVSSYEESLRKLIDKVNWIQRDHVPALLSIYSLPYEQRTLFGLNSRGERSVRTIHAEYLISLANTELAQVLLAARKAGMNSGGRHGAWGFAQRAYNIVDPACHPRRWCAAVAALRESAEAARWADEVKKAEELAGHLEGMCG